MHQQCSISVVSLPGGLVEDDRRLGTAALRPLTGFEEEFLAERAGASTAALVTHLLAACVVRLDDMVASRDLVQRLLVGDRDYLVLQLRRMTLGDRIQAVLVCPACGARIDVSFTMDEVTLERRPQRTAAYTVDIGGADGAPHTVCFRLPTGADQEAVLELDEESATEVLLDRCLLGDGRKALSASERAAVIDAMERLAPQLDLDLDLTCPECGHAFVQRFDTTSFFLAEMQVSGKQFLREVHALALHYHWSEADILALTRARRRAYLGLLSDTFSQR